VTVLEDESTVDKFDAPLYTQAEASRFLGLCESTFRNWSRGYHSVIQGREVTGQPLITAVGKLGQLRSAAGRGRSRCRMAAVRR
jgi:hypothetical protein